MSSVSSIQTTAAQAIPLTVPLHARELFVANMEKITQGSGRVFLFAADQKVEHLNKDFFGDNIAPQASDPEYLFKIASSARIGAFATHLGLIARYADQYRSIPYIVKLNGKTNLIGKDIDDPVSRLWVTVDHVAEFKKATDVQIAGIGLTVYLGSTYEPEMLQMASDAVLQAHKHGLIAFLWMYPRGKSIEKETSIDLVAGAAGVAAALGADFVKVMPPEASDGFESAELLKQATMAAGRTKVICAGGSQKDGEIFLQDLYHQIHIGGCKGVAIGRNIFQRGPDQALAFCNAVAAIIVDDVDVQTAQQLLR